MIHAPGSFAWSIDERAIQLGTRADFDGRREWPGSAGNVALIDRWARLGWLLWGLRVRLLG
jgi:hypothetical protein